MNETHKKNGVRKTQKRKSASPLKTQDRPETLTEKTYTKNPVITGTAAKK